MLSLASKQNIFILLALASISTVFLFVSCANLEDKLSSKNKVLVPTPQGEKEFSLILDIDPIEDIHVGESVRISGKIKGENQDQDIPQSFLANLDIQVSCGSFSYNIKTDGNGNWSLASSRFEEAGTIEVQASYFYFENVSISASFSFNVLKIDPFMNIINQNEQLFYNSNEQCINYDIRFPEDATGTVSIVSKNSRGNTVDQHEGIEVGQGGLALGETCVQAPGIYNSTIRYSGDNKYNSVSATVRTLEIVSTTVVVTISEHGEEKEYDGEIPDVSGYDVDIYDPQGIYSVDDFEFIDACEGLDYIYGGPDVGIYDMELSSECFRNINPNFEDVEFIIVDGQLVINPVSDKVTVTITENSGTYPYSGVERCVVGYEVSIDNPLYIESDFAFSGNDEACGINQGTYEMNLRAADFTNLNDNFSNVEFVIVDGTLEISRRSTIVTVALGSWDDTYDGQEHCLPDYELSFSNGLFQESYLNFNGNSTLCATNVGNYESTITSSNFSCNQSVTNCSNFELHFNFTGGVIHISPLADQITVSVTEESGSVTYNGTQQCIQGYYVSISDPLYQEADFIFSGDASVCGTNPGSYDMNLRASDFANTNSNFSNVEFLIEDGTLNIYP